MATSYSTFFVSFDMFFKLASIRSLSSMMYTAKFKPWALLFQAATCLNDGETLRQSPPLEALLTHICVVKDLAVDRGQQEERRERPYTRFKLYFNVFKTIRMGSP